MTPCDKPYFPSKTYPDIDWAVKAAVWGVPDIEKTGNIFFDLTDTECLTVKDDKGFKNGTPVEIRGCKEGDKTQAWTARTDGHFQLKDTDFCLDMTLDSQRTPTIKDGVAQSFMQIWKCFDINDQQSKYISDVVLRVMISTYMRTDRLAYILKDAEGVKPTPIGPAPKGASGPCPQA